MRRNDRGRCARSVALALGAVLVFAAPALAAGDELVLLPDPILLTALVVLFALLVIPVNALVFRPLLKVLDDREERVAGKRAHAQKLEREAEEILRKYELSVQTVRDEAEQARRGTLEQARNASQETTGEARGHAEREIERARAEIAAELETARATLRGEAQSLARQAASSVLGRAF